MSRYTDIDALKKDLSENYTFYGFSQLLNDFYEALDSAPSIDICFCRECKYTDGEPPIADGRSWCRKHYSYMYYCSDGERSRR